jgi:hypothetical protein
MKRCLLSPISWPISWLFFMIFSGSTSVAGADPRVELSAGGEYSSFKLSDGSTSTIWYAPFSARLDVGNWTFRATVPYISITAPGNLIVLLDDDPTGAGVGGNGKTQTAGTIRTVSGIGDSSLSATYSFDDIKGSPLYVDLGARVRLPTGNVHEGTGVGATDYGLQSEVGLDLDRWGIALNGGRRLLGQVNGLDRVDGWQAGTDAWLNLGPHALVGLYYDWRDASEPGLSNPRDAGVYLSYRLNRRWKMRVEASRALDLPQANVTVGLRLYWRLQERRDHH